MKTSTLLFVFLFYGSAVQAQLFDRLTQQSAASHLHLSQPLAGAGDYDSIGREHARRFYPFSVNYGLKTNVLLEQGLIIQDIGFNTDSLNQVDQIFVSVEPADSLLEVLQSKYGSNDLGFYFGPLNEHEKVEPTAYNWVKPAFAVLFYRGSGKIDKDDKRTWIIFKKQ